MDDTYLLDEGKGVFFFLLLLFPFSSEFSVLVVNLHVSFDGECAGRAEEGRTHVFQGGFQLLGGWVGGWVGGWKGRGELGGSNEVLDFMGG